MRNERRSFWIEDEDGNEVYRCERPADDNDGCGVELIGAKEQYCAGTLE